MATSWSDELIMQTREALGGLDLVPWNNKIHLKNLDGSFGYLKVNDWLGKRFIVHKEDLGQPPLPIGWGLFKDDLGK